MKNKDSLIDENDIIKTGQNIQDWLDKVESGETIVERGIYKKEIKK